MDEARQYELSQKANVAAAASTMTLPPDSIAADPNPSEAANSEPVVLSFAQLQALIEAGKADQIPNNKIIPEDLNVRRCCPVLRACVRPFF
jgi:hypothetical protein